MIHAETQSTDNDATGTTLAASRLFGPTAAAREGEGEEDSELPPLGEPDGWSSYRGTAGNTNSLPGDDPFPEPDTVAWEYDSSGDVAVADGQVYVRSDAVVHAIDDGDGSGLWTSDNVGAGGTPAVGGETVVVGGDQLTTLDAGSGEVQWSQSFESEEGVTNPTVAYDTVFVVASETLYALDLADESERWSRESVELEAPEDSDSQEDQAVTFVSTPAAVENELVYAGVGNDEPVGITAFDALTGESQWTYTVGVPVADRDMYGFNTGIRATENKVYSGGATEGIRYPILDAQTGERVDDRAGGSYFLSMVDNVVAGTDDYHLTVRNYETDTEWGKDAPAIE